MINVFKMDMRRIIRSKSFYVCLGLLCISTIFTFGIMYVMVNPDVQRTVREMNILSSDLTSQGTISSIGLVELFHQTNVSGGFLPLTTAIVAMLLVCSDFETGFIKNILAVHVNKWDYVLGKVFSMALVSFVFIGATFLLDAGLNLMTGSYFTYAGIKDVFFYLLTVWMINNGLYILIIMVSVISRNKAIGSAGAICLCSGLIVVLLNSLLGLFNLNGIMDYTLYMNLAYCPLEYKTGADFTGLIIGCSFSIVYTVISKMFLDKIDI